MKNIISDKPLNKARQPELDMAKAVIVFLLAFIHCFIECTSDEGLAAGVPYLFDTVIGGPLAAPMFMFAMGVGMVYTSHNSPADLAKRGLRLELAGFELNFARYTVPYAVGYLITGDGEKYLQPLLYRTLTNDILQFAGLAFLLVALFRKLGTPDVAVGVIAYVMSGASMFLNGIDLGSPAANIAAGYIFGTEDAAGLVFSDFPLLNWFIVPVTGLLFGKLLIRIKDKDRFYLIVSPVCFVITAAYFAVGIANGWGMFGEGQNCYYHIRINDVLVSILAVFALLGVYWAAARHLPKKLMTLINGISRNMTKIYCIHWVILVWTVSVALYIAAGTQELPVPLTAALSFAISAAAIALSFLWSNKILPNLKKRKKGRSPHEDKVV